MLITARPVINLSKNIEKQPVFVSKTGCLWVFIDYFLRSCRILACAAARRAIGTRKGEHDT